MPNNSFNPLPETSHHGFIWLRLLLVNGQVKPFLCCQVDRSLNNYIFLALPVDNEKLQILTLSACQTAEGDDRAPLGFSGIVVQAGVKSAIGSLWPIVDEVAQQLFTSFYQRYSQLSRAKALQAAQLEIMYTPKYSAPYY